MKNTQFELHIIIGEMDEGTGMSCKVIGDISCLDQAIRAAITHSVQDTEDNEEKEKDTKTALLFQKISEYYAETLHDLLNQGYEEKLDKQFTFLAKNLAKSYNKLKDDKNRR